MDSKPHVPIHVWFLLKKTNGSEVRSWRGLGRIFLSDVVFLEHLNRVGLMATDAIVIGSFFVNNLALKYTFIFVF